MERTTQATLVASEFKGVNQLPDEVKLAPAFVPWMFGLVPDATSSMQRVPGKILATTGSSPAIMSIFQLAFDGLLKVIIQSGPDLLVVTENLDHLRAPSSGNFPGLPFIPLEGGTPRESVP